MLEFVTEGDDHDAGDGLAKELTKQIGAYWRDLEASGWDDHDRYAGVVLSVFAYLVVKTTVIMEQRGFEEVLPKFVEALEANQARLKPHN